MLAGSEHESATDCLNGGIRIYKKLPTGIQYPRAFCRLKSLSGCQWAGDIRHAKGGSAMGKGNNSQKNDKKNKKPKQDKTKPAAKK